MNILEVGDRPAGLSAVALAAAPGLGRVEAALREGRRHQAVKSRDCCDCCDQDTLVCLQGDRSDASGHMRKQTGAYTFVASELSDVVIGSFCSSDLLAGTAFVADLYNPKKSHYPTVPRFSDVSFTPDALAAGAHAEDHLNQERTRRWQLWP